MRLLWRRVITAAVLLIVAAPLWLPGDHRLHAQGDPIIRRRMGDMAPGDQYVPLRRRMRPLPMAATVSAGEGVAAGQGRLADIPLGALTLPHLRPLPHDLAARSAGGSSPARDAAEPEPSPAMLSTFTLVNAFESVDQLAGALVNGGLTLIPPDTMGAVGPTQFITVINSVLAFQDKLTGAASPGLSFSLVSESFFFQPAHLAAVGEPDGSGDVRVRFDPFTGRWVFLEMGAPDYDDQGAVTAERSNYLYLALSDGPVITDATLFTYFYFEIGRATPPNGLQDKGFCDYPTLGLDTHALYIGCNVFDLVNGPFLGSTGFVVRRDGMTQSDLIAAGAVTAFRNLTTLTGAGAYTPQGVDNLDPAQTHADGYFIGIDAGNPVPSFNRLVLVRITNPGSPTPTATQIGIPIPTVDAPYLVSVPQPFGPGLDPIDGRLMHAVIRNGDLWTVHGVASDAAGNAVTPTGGLPDRHSVVWYEIGGLSGTPALQQRGVIVDGAAANPDSYLFPSLMVNAADDVLIGMTATAADSPPSGAVVGRLATDAPGTVQGAPQVYFAGDNVEYSLTFGGGRVRWGDYSYTSLDPCNEMSFSTIQEMTDAPVFTFDLGGGVIERGRWATAVGRLDTQVIPPVIAAVTPNYVAAGERDIRLVITGARFTNKNFGTVGGCSVSAPGLSTSVDGVNGVEVTAVTFVSNTEVHVTLSTEKVTAGGVAGIKVINIDGGTGTAFVVIESPGGVGIGGTAASGSGAGGSGPLSLPATGLPPISPGELLLMDVILPVLVIVISAMISFALLRRRSNP